MDGEHSGLPGGWREPCRRKSSSPKTVARRGEAGGSPPGNSQLVLDAGGPTAPKGQGKSGWRGRAQRRASHIIKRLENKEKRGRVTEGQAVNASLLGSKGFSREGVFLFIVGRMRQGGCLERLASHEGFPNSECC